MTGQATAPPAEVVPSEEEPSGVLARLSRLQALQIILVLAVIVVIFSALKLHSFLTVFNIRGLVQNTSILAVLGVGMTFVIITGGIDLSVGSVLVFSGVVADKAMAAMGGQGWGAATIGALVAIGCGLGWGLVNGFFIARAKVPPLIVTLGSLGMALGLAQVITGGVDLRDIPTVMVNTIGFGNIIWQIPALAVVAAVVVVIGIVLLHRTRFGLHTYAIGSNPEAGRRSGLNVPGQLITIYALSGLLAGFAGWLNLAFFQSTTISGQSTTNLSVIAGVVIGGTSLFGGYGSIFGSIVGLFIPATLQDGFVIIGIQPFWQEVVVGAVLIAAVYVDQQRRAAALRGGGRPRTSSLLNHLTTSRQAAPAKELPARGGPHGQPAQPTRSSMKAVVYDSPRSFTITEVPTPVPGPGEVRVRVQQTGICGTDLHIHNGKFFAEFPLTPGHELVGPVDALGDGTEGFRVGEYVAVNPNMNCGHCEYCRVGRTLMCVNLKGLGTNWPGSFAEYVAVPANLVYSVDGIDPDTSVFTEPTACAMHGVQTLSPPQGSSALVFGAGPTGLLLAQLIARGGAASVTVAASSAFKLSRAEELGIDATFLMDRADLAGDAARLKAASGGFDVVVDATGSAAVSEQCVPLTRSGGTVMFYGVTEPEDLVRVSPYDVFRREITIKGSFAEIDSFTAAIAALRSERARTDGLITHRFKLDDYAGALDALRSDRTVHKIIIECWQE
jgi:ribose transport system permease protein